MYCAGGFLLHVLSDVLFKVSAIQVYSRAENSGSHMHVTCQTRVDQKFNSALRKESGCCLELPQIPNVAVACLVDRQLHWPYLCGALDHIFSKEIHATWSEDSLLVSLAMTFGNTEATRRMPSEDQRPCSHLLCILQFQTVTTAMLQSFVSFIFLPDHLRMKFVSRGY